MVTKTYLTIKSYIIKFSKIILAAREHELKLSLANK